MPSNKPLQIIPIFYLIKLALACVLWFPRTADKISEQNRWDERPISLLGAAVRPIRSNSAVPYFYYRRQSHEKGSEQWKNRIAAGIGSNSQIRGGRRRKPVLRGDNWVRRSLLERARAFFANPPPKPSRSLVTSHFRRLGPNSRN